MQESLLTVFRAETTEVLQRRNYGVIREIAEYYSSKGHIFGLVVLF